MRANPYTLLILTTLFWAGNAVAGKFAVGVISPVSLTFARWLIACVAFYFFARPHLKRDWPVVRRHLPLLFTLGALGLAAFNIGFYWALNYTTAINVTIEQSAMPVLIILANYLFFSQRITALQGIGVLLTITGVLVTATRGAPLTVLETGVNRGDALMMLCVLLYGSYTVALRFRPDIHWTSLMFVLTFSATVFSAPFYAIEIMQSGFQLPRQEAWAIIAYTAIFPSMASQLFFIRGVAMLGANRAGLFINLVPIFGAILAVMILGESFRPYHLAGLLLVLGGIGMAERFGERRHI
ncbi:MAG: EamA family transporter [Gammaproteobacteria bacterium]|jgi:drug/metabolite transporter (DMT)-like permease|nr:EamA family transporter [Gammaproteobacteria bacterium]